MFSVICRPEVQHCCGHDDNGSIIAPLSEESLQLLLAFLFKVTWGCFKFRLFSVVLTAEN
jgi:hypothetical protein